MSKKKPASHSTNNKARKPIAKHAKILQSPLNVSGKDAGLNNWWDFNNENKYGLVDIHRQYFNDEGYNIYMYARSQGYSVKSAALMLALSANESGYGNKSTLTNKESLHNYWGIKMPGTQTSQQFASQEEGEEAAMNLFENNPKTYPDLVELLKQKNPPLPALDTAMYHFDPADHPQYPTYLHNNLIEGITVRALQTIAEDLAAIQKDIHADTNEIAALTLYSDSFGPTQQQRLAKDLSAIDELNQRKNDLRHIQQELQTGQAINIPFSIPDMPNSQQRIKKKSPATILLQQPPALPPAFVSEWAGAPPLHGLHRFSYDDDLVSATDTLPAAGKHYTSPAGRMKVRNSAVNNVTVQTNNTYNTHAATNNIHDEVVAILTSAVADARISTDLH